MPRRRRFTFAALLKLLLVLFVLAALVAIGVYAFLEKEALNRKPEDVPLIEAPKLALKARPQEPGGMVIPHRDKQVFDLLKKTAQTPPSVTLAAQTPAVKVVAPAPAPKPVAQPTPSVPTTAANPPKPASTPATADALAALIATAPAAKPAVKPIPKLAAAPKPAASTAATFPAGTHGVQVASFKARADAEKARDTIAKKHASRLGSLKPAIQDVKLNDGTVRYRLRFGTTTAAKAREVAAALKANGQDNFVVKMK